METNHSKIIWGWRSGFPHLFPRCESEDTQNPESFSLWAPYSGIGTITVSIPLFTDYGTIQLTNILSSGRM